MELRKSQTATALSMEDESYTIPITDPIEKNTQILVWIATRRNVKAVRIN